MQTTGPEVKNALCLLVGRTPELRAIVYGVLADCLERFLFGDLGGPWRG